jgi:GTP pyrophosphokinase
MGPMGEWIEVQIRSTRMDEIAERGFAAHWKYKTGEIEEETELNKWIDTIKEILENPEPNAIDFLDTIKLNLFASEIFVFTPKGDIKTMPSKSTALDFAFELHSELGFHCIGAKVNHKLVPMSHVLKSGDQVEILTSKSQTPKYEWLSYVTTGSAKTKLRARFRKDNKELIKMGEEFLSSFLSKNRIPNDQQTIDVLMKNFNCESRDNFLLKLAKKDFNLDETLHLFKPAKEGNKLIRYWNEAFGSGTGKQQIKQPEKANEFDKINFAETHKLTEEDIQQRYRLADCCQPIPGDEVLGFLEDSGFITLHKRQCPKAMRLKSSFGSRIVSTQWATGKELSFPVVIELKGIDQIGLVSQIAKIVSDELSVNMTKLVFDTKDGIFIGTIELYVHDVEEVQNLCMKLSKIKSIQSVFRKEKIIDDTPVD